MAASIGAVVTRLLEIAISGAALVLLAPLMALLAAAVFLDSGRPIFFSQTRLGKAGRHFRMYKFRKFGERGRMHECPLTMENDSRLTRVGRVLARTKLDELPQLWNVLRGDMSIVGPRPESLNFADCFKGPYNRVLDHRPGIFGPSQTLFRNEAALYRGRPDPERFYRSILFPLKAQIDLEYFTHRTVFRDVGYAIRGVFAVFGYSPGPQAAAALVNQMECWAGRRGDDNMPVHIMVIRNHCDWEVVTIIGDVAAR